MAQTLNEFLNKLSLPKLQALAEAFGHKVATKAAAVEVLEAQDQAALAEALRKAGVIQANPEKEAEFSLFISATRGEFRYNNALYRYGPEGYATRMPLEVANYIEQWLANNKIVAKRVAAE